MGNYPIKTIIITSVLCFWVGKIITKSSSFFEKEKEQSDQHNQHLLRTKKKHIQLASLKKLKKDLEQSTQDHITIQPKLNTLSITSSNLNKSLSQLQLLLAKKIMVIKTLTINNHKKTLSITFEPTHRP